MAVIIKTRQVAANDWLLLKPAADGLRGATSHPRIHFIEDQQAGEPVWLVGHSLGGLLSLMAACRRPDLARGLVMLDSPVITGWRAHSVAVFKHSGLIRKVSPGKVSQQRRHHWPDMASVKQHFASKPVFARWDPRVLDDYVAAGFVEAPQGGVQLRFSRERPSGNAVFTREIMAGAPKPGLTKESQRWVLQRYSIMTARNYAALFWKKAVRRVTLR